jgi:predicted transcriptional regulator
MSNDDLVYRLRKRAEIRRQILTRKSVQEGAPDRIADLLEEAADRIERQVYDKGLIEQAWRDSESYQVPMTEEGEKLAKQRFYGFQKGWNYAKFHTETSDVYMKDYYEYGPRTEDEEV